jgi:hypothetical protein
MSYPMPPRPHHVQLHEEPVLGHVRVECDGHRDLDVGAQLESNANLEKQFKLSVGSGIESRSTSQNCQFRQSHRPTRRKSDRVTILE